MYLVKSVDGCKRCKFCFEETVTHKGGLGKTPYIPNVICGKEKQRMTKKRGESLKIRPIIRVSSFSMPIDFVPVLE